MPIYTIKNTGIITARLIADFLYLPIWWYTAGALDAIKFCLKLVRDKERNWALLVWIKNLFKPMYGQYDFWGRLISFFMRLFQIAARSLILLFWSLFAFVLFLGWLALPAVLVYQILFQAKAI